MTSICAILIILIFMMLLAQPPDKIDSFRKKVAQSKNRSWGPPFWNPSKYKIRPIWRASDRRLVDGKYYNAPELIRCNNGNTNYKSATLFTDGGPLLTAATN